MPICVNDEHGFLRQRYNDACFAVFENMVALPIPACLGASLVVCLCRDRTALPIPSPRPLCSFRGKSFFGSNVCDESGGAVYNGPGSKMT